MFATASILFAAAALFVMSVLIGLIPIHRMIQQREAQHELRRGSASYLRRMGGWAFVFFWIVTVVFCATIIGDWGAQGDLDAALKRAGTRMGLLVRFAASLGGLR